jgi:hypothetical protein
MRHLLLYVSILLILFGCQENQEKAEEERFVPELIGDWVPAGFTKASESKDGLVDMPPPPPGHIERGYSFFSNGIVDMKADFFRSFYLKQPRGRRASFLETSTKYKVIGDSLKLMDLYDSTWYSVQIVKLTTDTLALKLTNGIQKYVKVTYDLEGQPTFDKIVLSTSGCYGTCPIVNIVVNSNGDIVYFGERYATKIGFFSGNIPKELYQRLQDNYRKANIKDIEKHYSEGGTDSEMVTVTFVQGNKIYKTIQDYSNGGPNEFVWANIPFRYLYQSIDLDPMPVNNLPYYLNLHYFKFSQGKK